MKPNTSHWGQKVKLTFEMELTGTYRGTVERDGVICAVVEDGPAAGHPKETSGRRYIAMSAITNVQVQR